MSLELVKEIEYQINTSSANAILYENNDIPEVTVKYDDFMFQVFDLDGEFKILFSDYDDITKENKEQSVDDAIDYIENNMSAYLM